MQRAERGFLKMDEVARRYEAMRSQSVVEPRTEPMCNRKRKRLERSFEVTLARGLRPAAFMPRAVTVPVFQA